MFPECFQFEFRRLQKEKKNVDVNEIYSRPDDISDLV
jgi:hypothetical protein